MTADRVVIAGAGQGGLQAAISLRQTGFGGAITLVGAEPGLPYQRPPLSKAYLAAGKAEALVLRPASFFASKDIAYLPGTVVEEIDRKAGELRLAGPDAPKRLGYGHLILATGTRNLQPPVEGLEHACGLRTLADADRLRARLATPQRIAVIGGGFIGLEFAAVARKLGHAVEVIEAAPRLMARAVSALTAERFARWHRAAGTGLHLGTAAASVDAGGVSLADGRRIDAGFVLLAAGVRPNAELAGAAGLETGNGIRVDAQLLTSDPQISALGDCACFPDPRSGRMVRLESVQAATDHARLIALRLAKGAAEPYAALPWFWSDQGDLKLQIAGLAGPEAREEPVADGVVARFDAQGLAAVETVGRPAIHMKARKLLAAEAPATLDVLRDVAAA